MRKVISDLDHLKNAFVDLEIEEGGKLQKDLKKQQKFLFTARKVLCEYPPLILLITFVNALSKLSAPVQLLLLGNFLLFIITDDSSVY